MVPPFVPSTLAGAGSGSCSGGTTPAPTAARLDALDGIRAIAVLAVLGYHAHYWGFRGGFVGVDVFFVLSGFLITRLLLQRDLGTGLTRGRYIAFLRRRAQRLLPAFAVMLIAGGLCAAFLGTAHQQATAVPCALASAGHVMNLPPAEALECAAIWHVSWSLAAEQQFYLVWPLLLTVLLVVATRLRPLRGRRPAAGAAVLCLGLLVIALGWQLALRAGGADAARVLFAPDGRSLIILAGCALALALHGRRLSVWHPPSTRAVTAGGAAAVAAIAVLVSTVVLGRGGGSVLEMWALVVAGAATTALIWLLVTHRAGRVSAVLSWRPLVWIGRISYSLYLWHEIAFRLSDRLLERGTLPCEVLRMALSFGLAWLSFRYVESYRSRRTGSDKEAASATPAREFARRAA